MNIGLSLPYTYLSNNYAASDKVFLSSLGPAEEYLLEMSDLINYIELGNFSTQAPADQIVSAVNNVWKTGLKVSLHPSLPSSVVGKNLIEIYPWMKDLLPEIKNNQQELMLNLHALAAQEGEEALLSRNTVTNLKWLTKIIESENLPIYIAVELNRSKGEVDPCTTYEGVVEICEKVDNQRLGIGWDIGHTYANYQNNLISRIPPNNFLNMITHTHIHDIGPDGKTHWPLTTGTVPLEEYFGLLNKRNYSGLYILELQPQRFYKHGDVREMILNSFNRMKITEQQVVKQ